MLDYLKRSKWFGVVATVAFFSLVFIGAMFLDSLESWREWKGLLNVAPLFGVLGALYGVIFALDSASGSSYGNFPILRTLLCAALGAAAVLVVCSWRSESVGRGWTLAGVGVGAVLGWFGWRWARYVDF